MIARFKGIWQVWELSMSMRFQPNLAQQAFILISVPLVFELIFVGSLSLLLYQADYQTKRETQAKLIIAQCGSLSRTCLRVGQEVSNLRKQDIVSIRHELERDLARAEEEIDVLGNLVYEQEKNKHSQAVSLMKQTCCEGVQLLREALQNGQLQDSKAPPGAPSRLKARMMIMQLLGNLARFSERQKELSNISLVRAFRSRELVNIFLVAGVVSSIILAIVLAIFFNRSTASRFRVLVDNTKKLGQGEQLGPEISGNDELAQLDKVFHQTALALREAQRSRQELMQMASHDLRSPLTSIEAGLTLLGEGVRGPLPQPALALVQELDRCVLRLISMINDLLDMEKLQAGMFEIKPDWYLASELFCEAREAVKSLAESHKIEIVIKDKGEKVFADKERLIQVLVNLLGNAIKFSPEETSVYLSCVENEKWLEISVQDEGTGVSPDDEAKIFRAFAQGKNQSCLQGSGLGLSIARAIVEAHGGSIGHENTSSGARFWLRLPCLEQPQD
jgi:signal transduction histidine kinase